MSVARALAKLLPEAEFAVELELRAAAERARAAEEKLKFDNERRSNHHHNQSNNLNNNNKAGATSETTIAGAGASGKPATASSASSSSATSFLFPARAAAAAAKDTNKPSNGGFQVPVAVFKSPAAVAVRSAHGKTSAVAPGVASSPAQQQHSAAVSVPRTPSATPTRPGRGGAGAGVGARHQQQQQSVQRKQQGNEAASSTSVVHTPVGSAAAAAGASTPASADKHLHHGNTRAGPFVPLSASKTAAAAIAGGSSCSSSSTWTLKEWKAARLQAQLASQLQVLQSPQPAPFSAAPALIGGRGAAAAAESNASAAGAAAAAASGIANVAPGLSGPLHAPHAVATGIAKLSQRHKMIFAANSTRIGQIEQSATEEGKCVWSTPAGGRGRGQRDQHFSVGFNFLFVVVILTCGFSYSSYYFQRMCMHI